MDKRQSKHWQLWGSPGLTDVQKAEDEAIFTVDYISSLSAF